MKLSNLDKLFSEVIRKRAISRVNGCERCLTQKHDTLKDSGDTFYAYMYLECSHFWGRGKRSVRYDEENAAGLCHGCHRYFTSHPAEHYQWFLERLGQVHFDFLATRARRPQKIDENLIGIYLRELIKEV